MRPCRHGLIGDHTVFHVVPHWRASPKIVAPSKRNRWIARVPRRTRCAHTRSSCSRNVTVWQVVSRHIQRRVVPPDPHWDPGPRRVDHLHHHAPVTVSKSPHNPGSQHSDHRTLCRAPDHTHAERQKPDGSPPSQRADHTDHNDQATQSSSKQGQTPPRSLTTAGVEDRSSSRTSTPTPNPRPTPTHPHSTLKSRHNRSSTKSRTIQFGDGCGSKLVPDERVRLEPETIQAEPYPLADRVAMCADLVNWPTKSSRWCWCVPC